MQPYFKPDADNQAADGLEAYKKAEWQMQERNTRSNRGSSDVASSTAFTTLAFLKIA